MNRTMKPTSEELYDHFGDGRLVEALARQLEEEYSPVQTGLIIEAPFAPGILQTVTIERHGPDPEDWHLRFDCERYREKIAIFLDGKLKEYVLTSAQLYRRAV